MRVLNVFPLQVDMVMDMQDICTVPENVNKGM